MTSPGTSSSSARNALRQTVRMPRESDGVGSALRNIFGGCAATSADFTALISRLDKIN